MGSNLGLLLGRRILYHCTIWEAHCNDPKLKMCWFINAESLYIFRWNLYIFLYFGTIFLMDPSPLSLLFSSRLSIGYVLEFLILTSISLWLIFMLSSLLISFSAFWVISLELPSISLSLPSIISVLLFNLHTDLSILETNFSVLRDLLDLF